MGRSPRFVFVAFAQQPTHAPQSRDETKPSRLPRGVTERICVFRFRNPLPLFSPEPQSASRRHCRRRGDRRRRAGRIPARRHRARRGPARSDRRVACRLQAGGHVVHAPSGLIEGIQRIIAKTSGIPFCDVRGHRQPTDAIWVTSVFDESTIIARLQAKAAPSKNCGLTPTNRKFRPSGIFR